MKIAYDINTVAIAKDFTVCRNISLLHFSSP